MPRNEAYEDAYVFNIKSFAELNEEEKIAAVKRNPEIILRLARHYKSEDSLDKNSLMYKLKMAAITQRGFGFLVTSFNNYGLSFNQKMVDEAMKSYPNLMREIDPKYLTTRNIHSAIKRKPSLISYIPDKFMDENMYQYCNKVLRLYVRYDEARFNYLPETIKSTRYSACNAYTNSSPSKVLQLTKEQLVLNGGKIMYKVVRKEPNLILCMMPEVWRKNLVLSAVTLDPTVYGELPEVYKQDVTVQYRTYRSLKLEDNKELIDEYFSKQEQKVAESKMKAWRTRQKIKEVVRARSEETVDVASVSSDSDDEVPV